MFKMLGKFLRSMPHRLSGLKLSNLSLYKACPMHAGRWHLPPCTSFWMHDNGRLTHCRVIETLGLERCIAAMAISDIYRSIQSIQTPEWNVAALPVVSRSYLQNKGYICLFWVCLKKDSAVFHKKICKSLFRKFIATANNHHLVVVWCSTVDEW